MKKKKPNKLTDDVRLKIAEAILRLPGDLRQTVASVAMEAFGSAVFDDYENILSFKEFVKQSWHLVEPETPFLESYAIDAIVEHLEAVARGDIRRLVICIPRRMGKSLISSVLYPAWLFSVDPAIRLICCSYSLAFVRRDAVKTRDLMRSNWYKSRYGKRVQIRMDQEQAHWFYTTKGGFRLATSPGGIGVGEGADIQIVDDPHKPQDVGSMAKRQAVIDWWEGTMSGSARDPNTLRRIVVQQRLHPADLAGVCIAKGYDALILPMEYDGVRRSTSLGYYDWRVEPGELLWPERFSQEDVEMLKLELGPRGYAAQCQQQPRGDELKLFMEEDWTFWQSVDSLPMIADVPLVGQVTAVPLPSTFDRMVISWDVGLTESEGSNWTVGQVWGEANGMYYLIDEFRFRGGYITFSEQFRMAYTQYSYILTHLIEETSVTKTLLDILASSYDGIVRVPPVGDKELRAQVASQLQKEHRLVIPLPSEKPWVNSFIQEFAAFGGSQKRDDDRVDACSQAIIYMRKNAPLAYV